MRHFLVFVVAVILPRAFAHMAMSNPPVRGYPGKVEPYDYDINAPLATSGTRVYPCQGKPKGSPVTTLIPGGYVPVTISGGARHNGGHCQWSISYDGGDNFVVLETIIRNCLSPATSNNSYNYSIPLPKSLPGSAHAIFSWSWINSIGNREFYMNCADVAINGNVSGTLQGPRLFVAQLPGTPTIPEFQGSTSYDGQEYFAQRDIIQVSPATPGAIVIKPGSLGTSDTVQSPAVVTQTTLLVVASQAPVMIASSGSTLSASQQPIVVTTLNAIVAATQNPVVTQNFVTGSNSVATTAPIEPTPTIQSDFLGSGIEGERRNLVENTQLNPSTTSLDDEPCSTADGSEETVQSTPFATTTPSDL